MDGNNVPICPMHGRHCAHVAYMGRLHSGLFPLNDMVHWSSLANHRQGKAVVSAIRSIAAVTLALKFTDD